MTRTVWYVAGGVLALAMGMMVWAAMSLDKVEFAAVCEIVALLSGFIVAAAFFILPLLILPLLIGYRLLRGHWRFPGATKFLQVVGATLAVLLVVNWTFGLFADPDLTACHEAAEKVTRTLSIISGYFTKAV
jgi:hypothetical protein